MWTAKSPQEDPGDKQKLLGDTVGSEETLSSVCSTRGPFILALLLGVRTAGRKFIFYLLSLYHVQ